MLKFKFSIRTRDGQIIERLQIAGRDMADAERKLRQMYHHCEILRWESTVPDSSLPLGSAASIDDILSLISKQENATI